MSDFGSEPTGDPRPQVTLVRHGETEWSAAKRHTGRTDLELTAEGEEQAKAIAGLLGPQSHDLVLVSPLRRARHTAELAGLTPYEIDEDLREWDYGDFEGLTTPEIQAKVPGWDIWHGPWPGGETGEDVAGRVDRVLRRVLGEGGAGQVTLVAHGHVLRVLVARWIGQPAAAGQWFALDTAAVGRLGWEHGEPVVDRWNLTAP